jgi:hypothetical protein
MCLPYIYPTTLAVRSRVHVSTVLTEVSYSIIIIIMSVVGEKAQQP